MFACAVPSLNHSFVYYRCLVQGNLLSHRISQSFSYNCASKNTNQLLKLIKAYGKYCTNKRRVRSGKNKSFVKVIKIRGWIRINRMID